ncbi:hypothetical protein Dimus_003211 [Dionaea muscipula]
MLLTLHPKLVDAPYAAAEAGRCYCCLREAARRCSLSRTTKSPPASSDCQSPTHLAAGRCLSPLATDILARWMLVSTKANRPPPPLLPIAAADRVREGIYEREGGVTGERGRFGLGY